MPTGPRGLRDSLLAEPAGISLRPAVLWGQPVPPLPSMMPQVHVTHTGLDADPTARNRGATLGEALGAEPGR